MATWIRFMTFLIFFFSTYPATQQSSNCGLDKICTPLNLCPPMLKYIRPGPSRNIGVVRRSICGFKYTTSLVCCPNSPSTVNHSPNPAKSPVTNLLPKLCGRPMIQNKIFGGTPTPIGAYPWVVALGYTETNRNGYFFECSGSIINERYVLTAAHCLHRKYIGRRRFAVVNLGVWNIVKTEDCKESDDSTQKCYRHMTVGFDDVILHPEFDEEEELANDIALIRLNTTLNFDSDDDVLIEPVCLPSSDLNVRSFIRGRNAIAAGWGLTQFNNYSNVMMSVELPLVSNKLCLERYKSMFVGKQLCAGGEKGKDTCIGDSGGPLVLSDNVGPPFIQVGIVSFGQRPCGSESAPSVYTSVARFRNWIEKNLRH